MIHAAALLAFLICLTADAQQRATLRGKVTDVTGATATQGTVRLLSEDRILSTQIARSGEFEFRDIPFGTYGLDATAPGFRITLIPQLQVDKAVPEPLSIKLLIGDMSACFKSPREIQYDDTKPGGGGRISVEARRYQPPILPTTKVMVSLYGLDGRLHVRTRTNGKGKAEFKRIAPGMYEIRTSADGYVDAKVQSVWVARGNVTRVNLSLLEAGTVILCQ